MSAKVNQLYELQIVFNALEKL